MELDVFKFDKKIAEVNKDFLSLVSLTDEDLEKIKELVVKEYTLKKKREESLMKSGYVPVDVVTELNEVNTSLLHFMRKSPDYRVNMINYVENLDY